VTIDALPDKTFRGHVTEIGNSPIQTSAAGGARQATNFKVVVVIDDQLPDVRPGFTCTADITTATRKNVTAVPIPAVAVRELVYDASGQVVKDPALDSRHRRTAAAAAPGANGELPPGQTRKETEGVFLVRDGKAQFLPIKMGIAGDKFFEVLGGVKSGDDVIVGPYNSVRGLADGTAVKVEKAASNAPAK
jgi:HlyD family secretion protein